MHYPGMEQLLLAQGDHMRAVGARLRRLIDALGIQYVEAAADMGIPKNQIGNWMRGEAYPRPYNLYLFCRKRGVSCDYVLLGDPAGLRGPVYQAVMRSAPEQAPQEA